MVEFFALSVIRAINFRLDLINHPEKEVYLKPDVDAQNAIVFDGVNGTVYWTVAACLVTNKIVVTELHFDKDMNLGLENSLSYDNIDSVINELAKQINLLRGY